MNPHVRINRFSPSDVLQLGSRIIAPGDGPHRTTTPTMTKITVEIEVAAPAQVVWHAWTTPSDIVQWNFASDDWCCPVF
jgi:hypothetical protein